MIDPKEFASRLSIGLTCILVLIATKFTVNMDLPRINYITIIDKIFFLFYFCAAITVIVSLIQRILLDRPNPPRWNLDKASRWLIPVLFFLVFAMFFFIHTK